MKVVAALLLVPAAVYAQSVRVEVVSAEGGKPIRAAVVSLISPSGHTVGEGLTTGAGQRLLTAPAAGTYRVRVRRIGYAPFVSPPIDVAAGDATPLVLRVPSSSVSLAGVRIMALRKACSADSTGTMAAAEVWDQIQTALISSELTERDSLVRTVVHNFSRLLRPDGTVDESDQRDLGQAGAQPFGTSAPEALSRYGFALLATNMSATYYAPDARVLLSPEFERDHCFDLVDGTGPDTGLVGLAFTPANDRSVSDIAGTLWVERATASLQRLDFQYTNLRYPVPGVKASGRVDFASLPSGAWYPQYWVIRMPQFGKRGLMDRWVLAGYKEMGGLAESTDATRIASGRGSVTLRVSVADAETGQFIDEAQVKVPDLGRVQRSDWAGETVFSKMPMGTQQVEVRRLGYASATVPLLVQGDTMELHVLLERQIHRLAPVKVLATVVNVRLEEYEMRRHNGFGHFLGDSVLARAGITPLPVVLVEHLPGLRIIQSGGEGGNPAGGMHGDAGSGQGMPFAGQSAHSELVPYGSYKLEATDPTGILSGPTCPVDIYLNGLPFYEDIRTLPTNEIAAVELYTMLTAPPQYRRVDKACKVLLLWTKD